MKDDNIKAQRKTVRYKSKIFAFYGYKLFCSNSQTNWLILTQLLKEKWSEVIYNVIFVVRYLYFLIQSFMYKIVSVTFVNLKEFVSRHLIYYWCCTIVLKLLYYCLSILSKKTVCAFCFITFLPLFCLKKEKKVLYIQLSKFIKTSQIV